LTVVADQDASTNTKAERYEGFGFCDLCGLIDQTGIKEGGSDEGVASSAASARDDSALTQGLRVSRVL
jgi:hypothetical protein